MFLNRLINVRVSIHVLDFERFLQRLLYRQKILQEGVRRHTAR